MKRPGLRIALLLAIVAVTGPATQVRAQTTGTADLSISTTWVGQGKPQARLGESVTLAFVVLNRGPETALDVVVDTNESDAFNFESATCSDPALCSQPGEPPAPGIELSAGSSAFGSLVWSVSNLSSSQPRTADVTVRATASTSDPNPDDNSVVMAIRLVGPDHPLVGKNAAGSLVRLIKRGDRDLIREWAAKRSISQINTAVARLKEAQRNQLAEVLLDTNATGALRERLLAVMRLILAQRDLGFYAEIWSYTTIEMIPGGFFGTCRRLFLDPDAYAGLIDIDARNVLTHESLHSFNCVNGGPIGSLDEGSALWVIRAGFPTPLGPGESWAEATFGTKLYYRDLLGDPNLPLAAPRDPSAKLLDVYRWLASSDPSQLPWNSTDRLVTCFERYFEQLDRNVDFVTEWLPAVEAATALMLADPGCQPV